MGDISAEPSMEDILSSIKRIIAEEGEPGARGPGAAARRAPARPIHAPAALDDEADEEVLELNQPIAHPAPAPASAPTPTPTIARAAPRAPDAAHVSAATVEATRGALDALSRLVVKPEPESDGTLEGLVRELLRPMMSAWLDRNLPPIVEQMVAREIAKITAGQHS